MNPGRLNSGYSSGFSLVELMLAMLIGLIIMGGVMQMYVSTRDTQRSSEDQLAMLGDARFAMETIAYDLRHTGIWGKHNYSTLIYCRKGDDDCPVDLEMPLATSDCADEEYINLDYPLFAENNNNPYTNTCITGSYKAGTDVLSVRYADTNKLGSDVLSKNYAYIRSSFRTGMLFMGPDIPDPSDLHLYKWKDDEANSNHLLISRVYFVSDYTDASGDGLPSLYRGDLLAGPEMVSDVLLRGVEDFQLEFGIDAGNDGQVNSYVNASNIPLDPNGDPDWNKVLALKVWLLMRSEREDRDNIGGTQQFTIAGVKGDSFDDGYRRYLVSGVVKLRNSFQIDELKVGG